MEGNRVHCFVMIREKFKHGGTVFCPLAGTPIIVVTERGLVATAPPFFLLPEALAPAVLLPYIVFVHNDAHAQRVSLIKLGSGVYHAGLFVCLFVFCRRRRQAETTFCFSLSGPASRWRGLGIP